MLLFRHSQQSFEHGYAKCHSFQLIWFLNAAASPIFLPDEWSTEPWVFFPFSRCISLLALRDLIVLLYFRNTDFVLFPACCAWYMLLVLQLMTFCTMPVPSSFQNQSNRVRKQPVKSLGGARNASYTGSSVQQLQLSHPVYVINVSMTCGAYLCYWQWYIQNYNFFQWHLRNYPYIYIYIYIYI
jgi:hypothetical protein